MPQTKVTKAWRYAKALNTDVNTLFDVKETRDPYAYNTNHHIKAAVRAVLSFAKKRLVADNDLDEHSNSLL